MSAETTFEVSTSRFGPLVIKISDIVIFSKGLLGFEQYTRWTIVTPEELDLIQYLQSIDDPEIALPIIRSSVFTNRSDISWHVEGVSDDDIFYYVLTIPQNVTLMTANMKAPIVVNKQLQHGRQVVLDCFTFSIVEPIYLRLRSIITRLNQNKEEI